MPQRHQFIEQGVGQASAEGTRSLAMGVGVGGALQNPGRSPAPTLQLPSLCKIGRLPLCSSPGLRGPASLTFSRARVGPAVCSHSALPPWPSALSRGCQATSGVREHFGAREVSRSLVTVQGSWFFFHRGPTLSDSVIKAAREIGFLLHLITTCYGEMDSFYFFAAAVILQNLSLLK